MDLFYTIERRKVKYARVTVYPDQNVKFVFPLRFPESHVQDFIRQQEAWVGKRLAAFAKPREKFVNLAAGEILLFGEAYRITFSADKKTLQEFYRRQAKEFFPVRVAELAHKFGLTYNRVTITGAKTRWGSCSPKKNLSFTYNLIKAPRDIIDYVILHELAHTKYLDHSRSFWREVGKLYPNYKEAKAWLRRFGRQLE